MNQRLTYILLPVALVLGALALWSDRSSRPASGGAARVQTVLGVDAGDIVRVRVKRDAWNSFALGRGPDGAWQIQEPFSEPASPQAARKLVDTIAALPVLHAIDMPGDDSERYREYGLWDSVLEITVTTEQREMTLIFGSTTPAQVGALPGVYCAVLGRDGVIVTDASKLPALQTELAGYRPAAKQEASVRTSADAAGGSTPPTAVAPPTRVQITDLAVGSGEPVRNGQTLTMRYVGKLEDGTVFDQGDNFTFQLGAGRVIKGWDEGIQGMRVGGKRRLVIPPDLAYGAAGSPPRIPPHAVLDFEVEVVRVEDPFSRGGIVVSTEVVGGVSREPGAELKVALRLDGNSGRPVATYAFELTYPPDVLTFQSGDDGDDGFEQEPLINTEKPGTVRVTGVSAGSRLQNGRMCVLTFRVAGMAPHGCDILLKPDGPTPLVDADFQDMKHTVADTATRMLLKP